MWRAALKAAIGHRARLLISGLVIAFSVGFVVATLVFTDTLSRTFETLFQDTFAGFDIQIRSEVDPELPFAIPQPLDEDLLDAVIAVDGVADAQGSVTGFLALAGPDGTAVETSGPPIFGLTWPKLPTIAAIRSGAPPAATSEVAIDAAVARRMDAAIGDTVTITGLGGPREVTVAGIVEFSGAESVGGTVSVFMNVELARQMFDLAGRYSTIEVVGDDSVPATDLAGRLEAALGEEFEAISAEALARQQVEAFTEAISFIRTFVLVFAGVALFVGTFVISNIFRVTIAQRTRELAVLRAIGATAGQIRNLMLAEALAISLIASSVGLLMGVGLAQLIRLGFGAGGLALPEGPLRVTPGTLLAGFATGVGVTTVSALVPAFKAAAVAPIQAMREGFAPPARRQLRVRTLVGGPLTGAGAALLGVGLFFDLPDWAPSAIWLVGAGAALMFVGLAVLAAVIARPVASVLGRPVSRLSGITGRLARGNAMRAPRRTGLTASALMVGLALVSLVSILAESARVTADQELTARFRSDVILAPSGFGGLGFSPEVARRVAALDVVERVGSQRQGQILIDGDDTFVGAGTGATFELIGYSVLEGDLGLLGGDTVALRADRAEGRALGDMVAVTFGATGVRPLELVAIYEDSPAGALIGMDTYEAGFVERLDSQVLVEFVDGVGVDQGRAALEPVVTEFRGIQIQDQEAFRDQASGAIGTILNILYALLAVSLVIGTLGVVGTLLLSVIERTREIGVLRAVGMVRGQVRSMITWEAVIIATFGGLLGTGIGLLFGWSVVTAIGDDLRFAAPWPQLVSWLVATSGLGILAAIYPARRGSRLDVLQAIAYE
ncbi:MAG TPA: ABC transporter permease [Acidimicrobiia bacterium]